MDDDFIRLLIIACIVLGCLILFLWMTSRAKRRVVKTIGEVQESLKLTPFVSTHPQLDAVWFAVRGQVSALNVKIYGGRSRSGRIAGMSAIGFAPAFVLIVVSLPTTVPFRFNIQRRATLSSPRFGTSFEDFDKMVEVTTENEKKTLTLLNNDQLRAAIISFIKLASNTFITNSEIIIKVPSDKQVIPVVREVLKLATLLGNQITSIR